MLKLLFVCTGNSARSQMAEAILNSKGKGRIIAYSAGSDPEENVNPYAVDTMKELGIDISQCKPKALNLFEGEYFDFVITLCDRARNQCPMVNDSTIHVHWGFADPKYFEGTRDDILRQFKKLSQELSRRVDLFLMLKLEKASQADLKKQLNEIFTDIGC